MLSKVLLKNTTARNLPEESDYLSEGIICIKHLCYKYMALFHLGGSKLQIYIYIYMII